jgi:AcrR family transcriptional regulator
MEVMTEQGVAGLSLADIARRMGMRSQSLYQYFSSRMGIYDALFERANRELNEAAGVMIAGAPTTAQSLQDGVEAMIRWSMENQVLAQLIFWRTVPGFEPSPAAYAPALQSWQLGLDRLTNLVEAGELRPEAATDEGMRLLIILIAGVVSQQMANEPSANYENGAFTSMTHTVFQLFLQHYAPRKRPETSN